MATKIKFTSCFGTARYPHLTKADLVGKFADGKWKTKLVTTADDPAALAFVKKIDEAATALHGAKGAKLHKPYVIDEDENEIVFTFKTSYAPALFDAKGKSLKGKDITIGAGSRLRVMGNIIDYEKGISAQINQVQITELNSYGECGFDAVEGEFSADDYDAASPSMDADDDDDDTGADGSLDI